MPLRVLAGDSPSERAKFLREEEHVVDTQLKRTLAWVCGSKGNFYALVLKISGTCVITCGGVVVRNCGPMNAAESMEVLMAMAAADGTT